MLDIQQVKANNYYFSDKAGNDSRTVAQARNPRTPWKSLSKLQEVMGYLKPGDSVLFKRGDIFDGSINVTCSGSAARSIVFGAYGKGSQPVINGFKTLKGWTVMENDIWRSGTIQNIESINMVLINGKQYAMGRYPNAEDENGGYLTFTSHNANNQITESSLASQPDYTGAQVVIRMNRWVIDHNLIANHQGNTLTFIPGSNEKLTDGFGYFIQDHISTLDQHGEWFYNKQEQVLYVKYLKGRPSAGDIKIATLPNLLTINKQAYVEVHNLCFSGASTRTVKIMNSRAVKLSHCNILYSGTDALFAESGTHIEVSNCLIANTNNNGVGMYCASSSFKNNRVLNTAMLPGMGRSGNNTYNGVIVVGRDNVVVSNCIDSTGYIPLRVDGDSLLVKNNLINHFAMVKDDAGGIYMYTGAGNRAFTSRRVEGNIVLNGQGAPHGTTYRNGRLANGIYMDDNTSNVDIVNNTVANCGSAGIFVHNSSNIRLNGNIVFNNTRQVVVEHEDITCKGCDMRDNSLINNILWAKTSTRQIIAYKSYTNNAQKLMLADSNYYGLPNDAKPDYITVSNDGKINNHTLNQWQNSSGNDRASQQITNTDSNNVRFEFNAQNTVKTIDLRDWYVDAKSGKSLTKVTLAPYSSVILIRKK